MGDIRLFFRTVLGYIYTKHRKSCHVETTLSTTTYHYTAQVQCSDTNERYAVHFHSHQNTHRLKSRRWWEWDVGYTTYRVVAEEYRRSLLVKCTEFTFPDTAPFLLRGTNYAHMWAIHAFIDEYSNLSA